MSVFDGEVKIGRTVKDPGSDHSLPPGGSLSFGAVKSVSALSGTTGVDACLITGNKWQQLNGKHTENVSMDHLLQILGNRQELVAGNHQHTIIGTTNNTHVGVHNHTNIAPRNDTFNHVRTEKHCEQEHQEQPTGRNESTVMENILGRLHFKHVYDERTLYDFKAEITKRNIDIVIANFESKIASLEVPVFHHETPSLNDRLAAFSARIEPIRVSAGDAHLKAIGADLNAGVAANADSPFA